MSFDIMTVFTGQNPPQSAAAPQQQQQAKPQEPAFQPNQNQDPDASKQTPAAPTSQKNPLDEFSKLFENVKKEGDDGVDPDSPDAPIFNIDPAKLQEEVSKMQFLSWDELKETASKALSGDPDALMQLLENSSRAAYAKAAQLSGVLSERASKTSMERLTKQLPSHVRNMQGSDELAGLNPVFNHPAVKPLIEPVRQQFQSKYPDSSPREIATMVQNYLKNISESLTVDDGSDPTARRKPDNSSQDFDSFF